MSEQRNWADLPWDALSLIFQKLNTFDVLLSTENVCISWRQVVVHDPLVWRRINVRDTPLHLIDWTKIDMTKLLAYMARKAVDRSGGDVEEFYADHSVVSEELLAYMAQRTTGRLRRLDLLGSHFSEKAVLELARRCPVLEHLVMVGRTLSRETYGRPFSPETYGELGRACPELKILTINFSRFGFRDGSDDLAFAIANNMTQLRELRLIFSPITDVGIRVILDKCLNLEILDLHGKCLERLSL